jgi:hypothetical protein
MTFPHYAMVLIRPGSDQHGPPRPVSVTSPPQVRYPYAGRSRVAQSAERPAVNRQVIGSSPIAGASLSLHRQPSHLRQRRKRGYRHGARSARAEQDSHKIPTTGSRPGRQAGEIQPHGTRQDARERDRACGHPGRRPGDRAGMRITVYPAREEQGRWRASGTRMARGSGSPRWCGRSAAGTGWPTPTPTPPARPSGCS